MPRYIDLQAETNLNEAFFVPEVNSYMHNLGGLASVAAMEYCNRSRKNVDCDPLEEIQETLDLIPPPKSVLTVVASGMPELFRRRFPKAKLSVFDINPKQLARGATVLKKPQDQLAICDILARDELTNLVNYTEPDLVFLSNTAEFSSLSEIEHLAGQILKACPKSAILLTQIHEYQANMSRFGFDFGSIDIWPYLENKPLKHQVAITRANGTSVHLLTTAT